MITDQIFCWTVINTFTALQSKSIHTECPVWYAWTSDINFQKHEVMHFFFFVINWPWQFTKKHTSSIVTAYGYTSKYSNVNLAGRSSDEQRSIFRRNCRKMNKWLHCKTDLEAKFNRIMSRKNNRCTYKGFLNFSNSIRNNKSLNKELVPILLTWIILEWL